MYKLYKKRKPTAEESGQDLLIALFAPKARHDSTNEKIALSVIRAPEHTARERSSTRHFLCTEHNHVGRWCTR
jgi:hypothetical protein